MARSDIHFGDGGVRGEMFTALALLVALGGCSNAVDVDQCADPTKLRVKVADTVFDLPKTTDKPHSVSGDNLKDENLGILQMTYTAYASNPANRYACNSKEKRIADFGNAMGLRYIGDGTHPKDYGNGDKMYAEVVISRYNPQNPYVIDGQDQYLANVEDIEKVQFSRRFDMPRKGRELIKEASFEFSYKDRKFLIECSIGFYRNQLLNNEEVKPHLPRMCFPNVVFRSHGILIGVDQKTTRLDPNGKQSPIPPEEWPKQWAYTINKILSYRIKSGEGASQ